MSTSTTPATASVQPDPRLDLVLERIVDMPPALVWAAWTEPKHILRWFTPAPWTTTHCTIDLRPGGLFHTVMRSPEGQEYPNNGCYLDIVPQQRLTWTNTLVAGFRPVDPAPVAGSEHCPFIFTATVALAPAGGGTRYTATVLHADEDSRKRHEAMGFREGWGTALDQLVAMAKTW
jgi:uncharacterized protein YndB with AHSA1/START domain